MNLYLTLPHMVDSSCKGATGGADINIKVTRYRTWISDRLVLINGWIQNNIGYFESYFDSYAVLFFYWKFILIFTFFWCIHFLGFYCIFELLVPSPIFDFSPMKNSIFALQPWSTNRHFWDRRSARSILGVKSILSGTKNWINMGS